MRKELFAVGHGSRNKAIITAAVGAAFSEALEEINEKALANPVKMHKPVDQAKQNTWYRKTMKRSGGRRKKRGRR